MPSLSFAAVAGRRVWTLAALFLAIEFLDELVFGTREAAWPLIRSDLSLSYTEIGLLLAVPEIVSGVVEPLVGLLGDTRYRRATIVVGGIAFGVALVVAAASTSVLPLLFAFALLYPASGAFVSLSQATLMDSSPGEHEHAMARWTFAGSIGVVLGPVILAAGAVVGAGWRQLFVAWAVLAIVAVLLLRSTKTTDIPHPASGALPTNTLRDAFRGALAAARRPQTWRWLVLLECADFMLDVLLGFVALYLVDSAGATPAQAGLAISALALTGLIGDGLIIPVLHRLSGLAWVRASAVILLPVFVLFLAAPGFWPKLIALIMIGLLNSGWYAVLQAQLYASLPGQSGAVVSISAAFGLVTALVPLALGVVAAQFGIGIAVAFLALGPIGLVFGLPRGHAAPAVFESAEATE